MDVDLTLIEKYNISGPRYTSYPTALAFEDAAEEDYQAAVARSGEGPISLYTHLPFCSTLCYYCACNKIVTRDKGKGIRYLDYLRREIEAHAPLYAGREVRQLHWGGGTPTFLTDEQISALSGWLREHFQFADDRDGEFSIEIDPRTVDPDRIAALRQSGFNRLSMGIQDFDARVQAAVNRKQSFEATDAAVEAARQHGFSSVSIDLIYGLPFQSLVTMDQTLGKVLRLGPDRISLYNYAHLPDRFSPQQRIQAVDLPAAEEKLRIFKRCTERLTGEGYVYIGMDHFARPDDELAVAQRNGTLQRNFQGYSTFGGLDLLALGVTGISQFSDAYFQNAREMADYEGLIDSGQIPVRKMIHVDEDDRIRRQVIMTLICEFSLDFGDFNDRFGIDFVSYFNEELGFLRDMASDRLVAVNDSGIVVSESGRLLIRNICMTFDRHLPGVSGKRFSRVI
ncbi:MAG: oxygen-independent coproporphyrinogen III oxidase [Proteobacteria bacterium]|nr:oxygen-independent coproporphyrinogen III oxidase [Pseudomonadota bacterium]